MTYLKAIFCLFLLWLGAGIALLKFPFQVLFAPNESKESARAIDQLCNASLFDGYARESLSSHAWRDEIDWVIQLTDWVEQGHCKGANRREQPIVDFINR